MMKNIIIIIFALVGLISCKPDRKKNVETNPLLSYLEKNKEKPNDYVIRKFDNHDIIFIGENHFIKQQVEFIRNLIPELYKNGIYNLGTEFIRYSDTELMNKLITDPIYNEELAKEITFNSLWHWGYQEYLDIYKEAWKLNQSLPKNAPKFKIFGIEEDMDWSYVKNVEDRDSPEIMAKVFKSSSQFKEDEGLSAFAIQKEVLNKNEKAIIHSGIHHAFTSYYQPTFNPEKQEFGGRYVKERMGNLIKNKIGNRTITIFLHGPWFSANGYDKQVLPVDGVLDSLFSIKDNSQLIPFGVDTKGTPFGELKGENSIYKYGYPNFTLKDFSDGYIFLNPISEYESVTVIPNFVTPEKVEFIKQQEFEYRNENLTAEMLNDTIRIWLIESDLKLKRMNNNIR
jgi:heme-binding uptake protein ChaN (Tiki superfamily)